MKAIGRINSMIAQYSVLPLIFQTELNLRHSTASNIPQVKYFEEQGSLSSIRTLTGEGLFAIEVLGETVSFFFFLSFPFPLRGEGDLDRLGELFLIGEHGKEGELRCLIGEDRL